MSCVSVPSSAAVCFRAPVYRMLRNGMLQQHCPSPTGLLHEQLPNTLAGKTVAAVVVANIARGTMTCRSINNPIGAAAGGLAAVSSAKASSDGYVIYRLHLDLWRLLQQG